MAALSSFLAFARAPLLWGLALAALTAPFAFIEPVRQPPPPDCTDWLWCDSSIIGVRIDTSPEWAFVWALIAIPVAFVCFLAARIAVRGPNAHAHWFMAGPALTITIFSIFNLFEPLVLWVDDERSYRPALLAIGQGNALLFGILAGAPAALITLLGAFVWRLARRDK